MSDWLSDIEAQADETSPYYLPRLIAEIRRLQLERDSAREQFDRHVEWASARLLTLEQALRPTIQVLERFAGWPENDIQGLRYHAMREANYVKAALAASRGREPQLNRHQNPGYVVGEHEEQ